MLGLCKPKMQFTIYEWKQSLISMFTKILCKCSKRTFVNDEPNLPNSFDTIKEDKKKNEMFSRHSATSCGMMKTLFEYIQRQYLFANCKCLFRLRDILFYSFHRTMKMSSSEFSVGLCTKSAQIFFWLISLISAGGNAGFNVQVYHWQQPAPNCGGTEEKYERRAHRNYTKLHDTQKESIIVDYKFLPFATEFSQQMFRTRCCFLLLLLLFHSFFTFLQLQYKLMGSNDKTFQY